MMAGRWQVLIAHAEDEEDKAEQLAGPIRAAGYEVAHRGTVLVGDSLLAEASKVLSLGGPVVVCATVAAIGTGWANEIAQAARTSGAKVFVVRMQQKVYTAGLAADEVVAEYWKDPEAATKELIEALQKHYPLVEERAVEIRAGNRRQRALDRYRALALESCDIVDLANLPEGDRHLATRTLELRRLFVSLRVRVEVEGGREGDMALHETGFAHIEERRTASRLHAAGRGGKAPDESQSRLVPLGKRLGEARRLVVLGDPGAGKTTLLRWLATAYLLRLKSDSAFKDLPDVGTLPDEDWLPVLIRCRDLDQTCIQGSLDVILRHTLGKAGMSEDEADALREALRDELDAGRALLLVDGLDEIVDPRARAAFCQQIEQFRTSFSKAPIVVTSRIVGYREMGYRIGRSFDHVTVADLGKSEKDDFARRWCALTEPAERRERATEELIEAIHSSERIERLTGNAMLLTTMALVKRQVGQLPSRRAELYYEAVKVLLRWRSEHDAPLDPEEALPQLEYLAYCMCDLGVQRLRKGEILDLLMRMRHEFPHQRRAAQHSPEEFLQLLERRTGLVVETGREMYEGIEVPVFEFRHLTFQEYMAGRALAYGRFPNPDREPRDAVVARLAGQTATVRTRAGRTEVAVTENWREALRLCVGCRRDREDIDATLLAILNARDGENAVVTARPRAVLAVECLADEPSIREETALIVLRQFIVYIQKDDVYGAGDTIAYRAALELAGSEWSRRFEEALVDEFMVKPWDARGDFGGLFSMVRDIRCQKELLPIVLSEELAALQSGEERRAVASALHLSQLAFGGRLKTGDDAHRSLIVATCNTLMSMLGGSVPAAHAAAWALGWMSAKGLWTPGQEDQHRFLSLIANESTDREVVFWSLYALEQARLTDDAIIKRLSDPSGRVRSKAAELVRESLDLRALEPLIRMLKHPNEHEWYTAIHTLGALPDVRAVQVLWEQLVVSSPEQAWAYVGALARSPAPEAIEFLRKGLEHPDLNIRGAIAHEFVIGRDARQTQLLLALHDDPDEELRQISTEAFAMMCSDEVDRRFLSQYVNGEESWLDPRVPIDDARVGFVAEKLKLSLEGVRRRYEALAGRFPLHLTWMPRTSSEINDSSRH
jgi:hypothetical protein